MKLLRTLSLAAAACIACLVPAQTGVGKFQKEAAKALGRKIEVIETMEGLAAADGNTSCERNPLRIRIRPGLDPEYRQLVLAHELGHVMLCAQGIMVLGRLANPNGPDQRILGKLGDAIISCYVDPLADAEAERRGFNVVRTADTLFGQSTGGRPAPYDRRLVKNTVLLDDLIATKLYCGDLRKHTYSTEELEKAYASDPASQAKFKLGMLRSKLGKPQCSDNETCSDLTRGLRDYLALGGLILIRNPRTSKFE